MNQLSNNVKTSFMVNYANSLGQFGHVFIVKQKEKFEDTKDVNRSHYRRTDNTMVKKAKKKRQASVHRALSRKLKFEAKQLALQYGGSSQVLRKGKQFL